MIIDVGSSTIKITFCILPSIFEKKLEMDITSVCFRFSTEL